MAEPAYLRITGIYLPELNVPGVTEADWATLRPWTDDTTPRTDKPVRFNPGLHHYTRFADGRLAPTWAYSPSFIYRQSPLYR